jgi:hypothetical protein
VWGHLDRQIRRRSVPPIKRQNMEQCLNVAAILDLVFLRIFAIILCILVNI